MENSRREPNLSIEIPQPSSNIRLPLVLLMTRCTPPPPGGTFWTHVPEDPCNRIPAVTPPPLHHPLWPVSPIPLKVKDGHDDDDDDDDEYERELESIIRDIMTPEDPRDARVADVLGEESFEEFQSRMRHLKDMKAYFHSKYVEQCKVWAEIGDLEKSVMTSLRHQKRKRDLWDIKNPLVFI